MLFNSMEFLIFFPIVVLAYFVIPKPLKNPWLLVSSYFFYMCWNARYALLLFFSTIVTYGGGLAMEAVKGSRWRQSVKGTAKKLVLAASLVLNLAILFYFKYVNFALDLLGSALSLLHVELALPTFDILLPVGISFYTFQALGYAIDVYRDEIYAERNFLQYALFVSFFPQLVAGPIERSKNLLRQLSEPKKFCYESVRAGLLLMLWGYFLKMVISDRCAVLVNTVYGNYGAYQGFQILLANALFAIQIYCDFMGYSVIAKGAALVLGYRLMDNFSQPYLAGSVKDFWRRWHISLSTWLRDYLYIPLGGNRGSRLKKYRNLMITFLVSGLWHGADIKFILWGGIHGVYQIAEDLLAKPFGKTCERLHIRTDTFSWKLIGIVWNFILVDIAWVFFRADSVKAALEILRRSVQLSNSGLLLNGGLYQLGLNERNMTILLIALAVLLITSVMQERGIRCPDWLSKQNAVFRYAVYWGAVVLIIFSMDITGQEFLYFQF